MLSMLISILSLLNDYSAGVNNLLMLRSLRLILKLDKFGIGRV
jgi:hypothetical protein